MASSKLRDSQAPPDDDVKVDMSPMIDLVFLLLIFFLVNATMIIVKQDANVEPPIAKHATEAKDGKGRIVINIYKDGEIFNEDGTVELVEDEDIFDYVQKQKEDVDLIGFEPRLHLRGDKRAVFKHCRRVIRLSAKAGVDQVIFATYGFEPN